MKNVCFVIMGFGKKTDYESGRTLDLNASFDAIIKPAVENAGLRCIRADEITHSGLIDTVMYEMLFHSELVIADISTGNVNAVYELGVRHALRPNSTIIMKESEGRLHFDLNHINTFTYRHLGEDIGVKEADRARATLGSLISQALSSSKPDSPVYSFLPQLNRPVMSEEQFKSLLDDAEVFQDSLAAHLGSGEAAIRESRFDDAIRYFESALKLVPYDPYTIQQLALATYKSENPSELLALMDGINILNELNPQQSNDPETLGIAGAIYKRLWLITGDRAQLDRAIKIYSRGYDIRGDYYNGENLATCYDLRKSTHSDNNEALYDQMSARKTREEIISGLSDIISSDSFEERTDKKWIYATYSNCQFFLGELDAADEYEKLFLKMEPSQWEIDTYKNTRLVLSNLQK
jgi:tetratricopeptide (TPR) repeat protein